MATQNPILQDINQNTTSALDIVQNLLKGVESPDSSRLDNAWGAAGSGLDIRSPFVQNMGRDLYGKRASERQQSGIDNLLKILGASSGSLFPTTGQDIQSDQWNRGFAYQQQQDAQDRLDAQRAQSALDRENVSSSWNKNQDGRWFFDQFGNKKPLVGISTFGTPY